MRQLWLRWLTVSISRAESKHVELIRSAITTSVLWRNVVGAAALRLIFGQNVHTLARSVAAHAMCLSTAVISSGWIMKDLLVRAESGPRTRSDWTH